MDWTEKYRPTTLAEVRGNNKARDAFREWAETWDDHREAVVLHGSPGVGKTSAAHALAADTGWETVELNASDQRTADVIERFAGRAARNATLGGSAAGAGTDAGGVGGSDTSGGRQLIIIDEADNIHGTYDRGGSSALTRLLKESGQPIVLIANDYYDMSRGLRDACREIEFRDVSARSIVPVLRDICRREEIEFESAALEAIAEANSGDLRSAVRDLQATVEGRDRLTTADVHAGRRDRTVGIFEFLNAVLKEESAREALRAAYDTDETPDDLVRWIEDKVSMVYDDEELIRSYEFLANADRWLGRVRATQDYGYWRYVTDNVAAGVAASRDGTHGGWTRYGGPPFRSNRDATRDDVLRRLAEAGGTSMATARREVLPLLSAMIHHCKPRGLTVAVASWYDFDESHVAYVTGSGESTKKVTSIVEDAREISADTIEEHAGGAFAPGATGEERGDDESESGDGGSESGDDGAAETDGSTADEAERDEAESDDGQAGLGDFM